MKKGTVLNRLNNGWIMLQFEDGTKNRFPPNLLTDQGPKEEEKAVEQPKPAQPAASQPVAAAAPPQPPVQSYQQPPAFVNQIMQPAQPLFTNYDSNRKLPEPTAGVGEVQQWLNTNGFGKHMKDAAEHHIDGWSFRYLQHLARTSTPKEFAQIMRTHFPRMTIGQISSMGGRLLYKPGESVWD